MRSWPKRVVWQANTIVRRRWQLFTTSSSHRPPYNDPIKSCTATYRPMHGDTLNTAGASLNHTRLQQQQQQQQQRLIFLLQSTATVVRYLGYQQHTTMRHFLRPRRARFLQSHIRQQYSRFCPFIARQWHQCKSLPLEKPSEYIQCRVLQVIYYQQTTKQRAVLC